MADTVKKFLTELRRILHLEDERIAREQFVELSRRILRSRECENHHGVHELYFQVASKLKMEFHTEHNITQAIVHTMPPPNTGFVADGAGFAQAVATPRFVSSLICGND